MINIMKLSGQEIKLLGYKILSRELGPSGLIRFLREFETGEGDYTKDRRKHLEDGSVEELSQEIIKKRSVNETEGRQT